MQKKKPHQKTNKQNPTTKPNLKQQKTQQKSNPKDIIWKQVVSVSSVLRSGRWWFYIEMWWLLSIEKDPEVAEGPTITLKFEKNLTTGFTAIAVKEIS